MYTRSPHGCLFLHEVYKLWFWAYLHHNIPSPHPPSPPTPQETSTIAYMPLWSNFSIASTGATGISRVQDLCYVMLMSWFGVPMCTYSTHLDPTPSHDTGLEFGLLIHDFFLWTPSKLQMDVKIPCHFQRWQMKFPFQGLGTFQVIVLYRGDSIMPAPGHALCQCNLGPTGRPKLLSGRYDISSHSPLSLGLRSFFPSLVSLAFLCADKTGGKPTPV